MTETTHETRTMKTKQLYVMMSQFCEHYACDDGDTCVCVCLYALIIVKQRSEIVLIRTTFFPAYMHTMRDH